MAADSPLRTVLACVAVLTWVGLPANAPPLAAQETQGGQKAGEATEPAEAGEDQKPQRLFFDSVDVDLVEVEVVVTDKHGQPVTGLTRDDFEVFEDGRKVDLTHCHEVRTTLPDRLIGDAAPAGGAAEAVTAPADKPQGRRLVILVDNANLSLQSRKLLFTRLREHLLQSSALADQVLLATLDRNVEIVLPFTGDRARILAALDETERHAGSQTLLDGDRRMFLSRLQQAKLWGYNQPQAVEGMEGDPDFDDAVRVALDLAQTVRTLGEQRYRKVKATAEALGRFCAALGGMPGRKALIYLSDGLPLRPADSLTEAWTGKFQSWALENSADIRAHSVYPNADQTFQRVINSLASTEFDLHHEIARLTTTASAERVAFYPISVYGRSPDYLSAATSGGGISAGSGSMLRGAQVLESATRDASLLQLAEDTGGQALIHSANFGELLERVERDFASYYALGYRPPRAEDGAAAAEAGAEPAGGKDERQRGRRARSGKDAVRGEIAKSGALRKTEVKVKREGAVVRHGRGYNPQSWRQRLGAMTLAGALFAVESNPLGVELELGEATRDGDRFRVAILLKVPFDQIRLVYQEERYVGQLTALVVVRNEADGGLSEPRRIDFPIEISGRRILEAVQQQAGYVLELDLDPGPKRIAVGLRDHFARTEATVNLAVMVGEGKS